MATTKTQIQSGSAVIAYCLEIEGYPYVLTTWGQDASAVVTAYSGTDWSQVLGGLRVQGPYSQEIKPLDPAIDAGSMSFVVERGAEDTFGKDVFSAQKSSGDRTDLTASTDPDDTTLTVRDTSDFASSGHVYIGTERIQYTGKTGAPTPTFTGCTRGKNAPFAIDGGTRFGRHHAIGQTAGEPTFKPIVTDFKRVWIGSMVALRVFRVVNGVLDTRSESHLLFAGTLSDLQMMENGNTQIVAVDIRQRVANAVLLSDQYSAEPLPGAVLGTSDFVKLTEYGAENSTTDFYNEDTFDSSDLGTGRKTAEEVIDAISDAINASGSLTTAWAVYQIADGRVQFATGVTGTTYQQFHATIVMSDTVAALLGFDTADAPTRIIDGNTGWLFQSDTDSGDPVVVAIRGKEPAAIAALSVNFGSASSHTLTGATGTFLDQGAQIPQPLRSRYNTDAGGNKWGFLRFRELTVLAEETATDTFSFILDSDVLRLFEQKPESVSERLGPSIIREGSPVPRVKQVVFFEETFADAIPRLFASTGVSGHNESTYDDYDRQLGVGMPWELLGDAFLASVRDIAELGETVLTIMLDRPTRLVDILVPELALRDSHLVFKEGLRLVHPKLSFNTADHTLTDSTMVDDPGRAADVRPVMRISRDMIINVLKVEYNRSLSDEYQDVIEIRNQTSITEQGEQEPVTIKARNTMAIGRSPDPTVIHELLARLAGSMLAIYDEPLTVVGVAVSGDVLIDVAPSDSVSLSNSFVRYHGDGALDVTNVAAYVLQSEFDPEALRGHVTLVLTGGDLARAAIFSPAAKIDESYGSGSFTAGYDSSGPTIRLKANEFSLSTEADDITHLAVDDRIRVIEKSPATPGSPQSWTVTIDAKDEANQELDLSAALTGFDTSKEYYVVSDDYSAAATSQKTDCYIADDSDDKINNAERSRTFRDNSPSFELQDATGSSSVRHEYPPTDGQWWSENKPLHPAAMQALVRSVNNLISHRTAPQCPVWLKSFVAATTTSETAMLAPIFVPVLSGFHRPRTLTIGPRIAVNIISTGTVVVYSSSRPPRATDGASSLAEVEFPDGFTQSVSFSTASTTQSNATAKTLTLVPNTLQTGTWITVMGKNATSNATRLYGFHTWYMGAVT